jgi:hypothetical protein
LVGIHHHASVEALHNPERANNDNNKNGEHKDHRQELPAWARVVTDMKEEEELDSALHEGEH